MNPADTLVLMTQQSTGGIGDATPSVGSDEQDEFRYLASDAARVGRQAPLPRVRRVEAPVSDGRSVSALSYGSPPPAGDTDADTVAPQYVFLHGMGLNAHGFDPVVLALDAPALALDLPGHGRSDWREDANYRPDLLAADVLTALEQLATEPFVLVGHSLGGLMAARAALRVPEKVRALVLEDPAKPRPGTSR